MSRSAKVETAGTIVEILSSHCNQIRVAGSIRRGAEVVNDIDIVAEPRILSIPGLFGDTEGWVKTPSFTDAVAEAMATVGMHRTSGGDRLQNFHVPSLGCDVNLFLVSPPASWGAILLIRTGPTGYSHLLVTSRLSGGAMPPGMRQADGCLWESMTRIDTPTEEDYCRALEIPYWDPAGRSQGRLRSWLERKQ